MGCYTDDKLVWADRHGNKFYSCPMRFVTDEIIEWYKEYEYYKEFNCSPDYTEQSNRFVEAWMQYKYYYSLYDADRQEDHARKIRESTNRT